MLIIITASLFILLFFQTAPLTLCVSSFSATSYDKCIYVIGGGPNGKLATDSMQCYNSISNEWTIKSPMPVEAKCTNAVTFKDFIYVVGMFQSRDAKARNIVLILDGATVVQ